MKKNVIFFNKKLVLTINLLLFAIIGTAQEKVIKLSFKHVAKVNKDAVKTLQSVVKVRDISEQYSTGGLYLMTHYGNLNDLFNKENQKAIDNPMIETWRFCSIFSTRNGNSVIMGRNWDNQNVGSIIVSLYKPPNSYASISFSRAIDMGFPLNLRLDEMAQSPYGEKLLTAPFYAYDGINEHGLCAAVTGINTVKIKPKKDKDMIFVGYLIRKLLDQTKSVDEAVKFVEKYIPFDLNKTSLSCHFCIVDQTGKSVILEYQNDEWKKIYSDRLWQIMTNKPIYHVPEATLIKNCWRYKKIAESLENKNGKVDWLGGMQLLRAVSQKGTTWSIIYSPPSRDIYFSVYQTWGKIYHLNTFSTGMEK